MKAEPTRRPTFADFGAMLAKDMQDFGTVTDENCTMEEVETANNAIESIGQFADEIFCAGFPGNGLRSLMMIVNDYAISANNALARSNAKKALDELVNIIRVGQLIESYKQEIFGLSVASATYSQAIAKADAEKYLQGR